MKARLRNVVEAACLRPCMLDALNRKAHRRPVAWHGDTELTAGVGT